MDDLYQHIIDSKIDDNNDLFAGFFGCLCFTKYNNGGENNLVSMAMDYTETSGRDNGRGSLRNKIKLYKDNAWSIGALEDSSPSDVHGLSIEQRMVIVELTQLEKIKYGEKIFKI